MPDPHKRLKDTLLEEEWLRVMKHIYEKRENDWADCSGAHTWGNNAMLRGDSTQKFVLAHLNLSCGFGPERSGPLSRTLLLVLRRGDIHKERRDTDQQVAVWRHRDYRLCSVLATSLAIINRFVKDDSISFLHEDKFKRAPWWDIPLVDWQNYSDHSSAIRQVYKETGIVSSKITHDRTHAIQYSGAEGLMPYQLHALSKHLTEKFHRSYQSEADKEVRKNNTTFI